MSAKLPAWVSDNVTSVLREAARYRGMLPEEKLSLVASACRTAGLLLDASPNRERALSRVDPLPASTTAALERLMRSHREARGRAR